MNKKVTFLLREEVYSALESMCDDNGFHTVGYGLAVLVTSSLCSLGYLPLPEIPMEEDEQ